MACSNDFDVSWTINDLQIIFEECKNDTKIIESKIKECQELMKKMVFVDVYDANEVKRHHS